MNRFDEIYRKYQRDIYNFIFSRVRNSDITDDLCQEVFQSFYLKMEEIKDPKSYLYKSAKNCIIDCFRKEKNRNKLEDTLISAATIEERESVLEKAEKIAQKFAKDEIEEFIYVNSEYHGFTIREIKGMLKDSGVNLTDRQIRYALIGMKQRIVDYVNEHDITNVEDLFDDK